MSDRFKAIVIEDVEGKPKAGFKDLATTDLPDYPVLVDVAFSTLNYKDGLAITGKGKIARKLPLVAGIDLAGTVAESADPTWKPGDRVVVNGWGLSETEWGGYTQRQRLKPEWLVRVPDNYSLEEAMVVGTAGYTAMLSVLALEDHGLTPGGDREVLVTGAKGGVGSVAVAVLAHLGYRVTASTGTPEAHDYLSKLGATGFVDRASLEEKGAPLQKERWAGAVDTVGSQTLATVLSQAARHGAVAACGLAGGFDLPTTVMPFILRGVCLYGIDSVMCPQPRRQQAWDRLARDLNKDVLKQIEGGVEPLSRVPQLAEDILAGKITGRVVIDVNA